VSEDFLEAYLRAINVKEHYTGWLVEHWHVTGVHDFPFLRVEHLEHFPAEMYWFYMNLPYEIQRRVHIEIDGMPLPYFLDLISDDFFAWDSGHWLEYDGTGNIIKGKDDADIILVWSSEWNLIDSELYRIEELMQKMGLSDENPITFEWIMANPKDTYALRIEFRRQFFYFHLYY